MAENLNFENIMTLKLYIENPELKQQYQQVLEKVNNNIYSSFPDAGFDIFMPKAYTINGLETKKINLGIKCAAFMNGKPSSFYVYPRSSISKTKLRLANSTAIIDSGYRGELGAYLDNISPTKTEEIPQFSRLLQICSPTLMPIKLEIVASEDVLGSTERGAGGFGSTGGTIHQNTGAPHARSWDT